MRLIAHIMSLLAPDSCLDCGVEGFWLCPECSTNLTYPDRCYVCKNPAPGSLTCPKCVRSTPITALFVVSSLDGLAKKLVWALKYRPSRSVATNAATLMAWSLPHLDVINTVVVYVPTTPGRVRERAFDQAEALASEIARKKGLSQANCLKRVTNFHQVGSTRKDRFAHMKNAFICVNPNKIVGKTVLLVDDVITTGATLESAARVLKKAGASRVIATVFARAE